MSEGGRYVGPGCELYMIDKKRLYMTLYVYVVLVYVVVVCD